MNIISYRGPGAAGGLSSALERAWNNCNTSDCRWSFLSSKEIRYLSSNQPKGSVIASLSQDFIDKHYRFCNEFLWPVLHDLPQFAKFSADDFVAYKRFNETFAWLIIRAGLTGKSFVQDYQFALIPQLLKDNLKAETTLFWHIPWPKHIRQEHLEPMIYVAKAMLAAETIGFHTTEYVQNFRAFVQKHLPNILIEAKTIIAQPLGVDINYWSSLVALQERLKLDLSLVDTPFVLSVDRADYTKGVKERLTAIDIFFEYFPEYQEKITFVQITGKTRNNIAAFDNYWQQCQKQALCLNQKWSKNGWQPLLWVKESLTGFDLAWLYMKADVMLVNPIRDGLNLTAKEFVICQKQNPGALVLATGAGVVHEFAEHALIIESGCPEEMANGVKAALELSDLEKMCRISALKEELKKNTLIDWWNRFTSPVYQNTKAEENYEFVAKVSSQ